MRFQLIGIIASLIAAILTVVYQITSNDRPFRVTKVGGIIILSAIISSLAGWKALIDERKETAKESLRASELEAKIQSLRIELQNADKWANSVSQINDRLNNERDHILNQQSKFDLALKHATDSVTNFNPLSAASNIRLDNWNDGVLVLRLSRDFGGSRVSGVFDGRACEGKNIEISFLNIKSEDLNKMPLYIVEKSKLGAWRSDHRRSGKLINGGKVMVGSKFASNEYAICKDLGDNPGDAFNAGYAVSFVLSGNSDAAIVLKIVP